MVKIEIDGKQVEAEPGSMIIEVADREGVHIPRFCYHRKLSIAANCRMCIVEVEKMGKPVPACATPVTDGMCVFTKSEKARASQKAVMEFLLINHPLDCPICDQGGECELQDVSLGFGQDISRFAEGKRAVKDKNLGPLVATDMTRCIHCTRCVRFGQEIAGVPELGLIGRGENTEIGMYIEHSMASELSGNIIDLCPVGALTSKPFRFAARAWELRAHASIAAHDCVGSNIYLHTRCSEIMRAVPNDNEAINETWISDRDRYSYQGFASDERVTRPLLRKEGKWQDADWQTAFQVTVDSLKKVIAEHGADQVGVILSPNATLEEHYLLQKLARALDCHNIDHRLRETDFSDQASLSQYPSLGMPITKLEKQDMIFLLGANIQHEQPLLGHRVRKASLQGANVTALSVMQHAYNFSLNSQQVVHPTAFVNALAAITKAAYQHANVQVPAHIAAVLETIDVDVTAQQIAEQLKDADKASIILGNTALYHPQAAYVRTLAHALAQQTGASVGTVSDGANSAGACLAGSLPHRGPAGITQNNTGLDTQAMFAAGLKAYVLFNVEPELDCANPGVASEAVAKADFVVAMNPYNAGILAQYGNVILPIVPVSETSGTFINIEGIWQHFAAATVAQGQARPGWKVLRVLGNLLEIEGFNYVSSQEVCDEIREIINTQNFTSADNEHMLVRLETASSETLWRITQWPIYRVDNVVRRAPALQAAASSGGPAAVHFNRHLADKLQLTDGDTAIVKQGDEQIRLKVAVNNAIPNHCALVPGGFSETANLLDSFAELTIVRS